MPPFGRRRRGTKAELYAGVFREMDMRVHNISITVCESVYWNQRCECVFVCAGSGVSEKCRGNTEKCIEVKCCRIRSTRYLFSASNSNVWFCLLCFALLSKTEREELHQNLFALFCCIQWLLFFLVIFTPAYFVSPFLSHFDSFVPACCLHFSLAVPPIKANTKRKREKTQSQNVRKIKRHRVPIK